MDVGCGQALFVCHMMEGHGRERLSAKAGVPSEAGLMALTMLLRFQGIAADPDHIRHRFGADIHVEDMLRCAKELNLKARQIKSNWTRLTETPLPGIACLRDGGFSSSARWARIRCWRISAAASPRPDEREEFEDTMGWRTGADDTARKPCRSRRAALTSPGFSALSNNTGICWAKCCAASFFLQLFALVSPLFFPGRYRQGAGAS